MATGHRLDEEIRRLRAHLAAVEKDRDAGRRAQDRLAARAAGIGAVLDATSDGIVTIGEDGRIATFNRAAERIFGYGAEEVIGAPFLMLAPPSQHARQAALLARCRAASEPRIIFKKQDVRGLKKNGKVFPFELSIYRVHGEDRVFFTGILHDLTERRVAEEALVGVSEAVRESIGQELHDVLGQQLTGMALLAKSLENRLAQDAHEGAAEAAEVGALAHAALTETKRLAHGLYPTELERHGLAAALAELAFTQEKLFGVRCRLSGRVDPDLVWKSSALHLYRIAQEAVSNAVKHADTRCIDMALLEREDAVIVEVRDEGSGWRPETEPAGMGLIIMRYRARMIGAAIDIRQNQHGGTTVTCTLPVDRNALPPEERS